TVGRRQLVRADGWHPVLAHEVAHGRTGANATQDVVVFVAEHLWFPSLDLGPVGEAGADGRRVNGHVVQDLGRLAVDDGSRGDPVAELARASLRAAGRRQAGRGTAALVQGLAQ